MYSDTSLGTSPTPRGLGGVNTHIRKKTGLRPMRQTPQDAWDAQDTNLQSGHTRSDAIVGDTSTNVC